MTCGLWCNGERLAKSARRIMYGVPSSAKPLDRRGGACHETYCGH